MIHRYSSRRSPLKDFVATRLQGARRYDRIAGFFSSSLLEVAGEALERKIRESVIKENLLDAVIGLPANLFYGTGIPAALMIFDKSRKSNGKGKVLFIDASRGFEQGTNQNILKEQDIEKIIYTYRKKSKLDKYSYLARFQEIQENEFNLNIPRYVDTFEEEEEVDIAAVQQEIDAIEEELVKTRTKMKPYLKELGC